jgi:hypothetical protein
MSAPVERSIRPLAGRGLGDSPSVPAAREVLEETAAAGFAVKSLNNRP